MQIVWIMLYGSLIYLDQTQVCRNGFRREVGRAGISL